MKFMNIMIFMKLIKTNKLSSNIASISSCGSVISTSGSAKKSDRHAPERDYLQTSSLPHTPTADFLALLELEPFGKTE